MNNNPANYMIIYQNTRTNTNDILLFETLATAEQRLASLNYAFDSAARSDYVLILLKVDTGQVVEYIKPCS